MWYTIKQDKKKNRYKVERNMSKDNYKKKIRKHKMAAVYRSLMVLAVLATLAVIIYVQYRNHIYTDYEYISETRINKVVNSRSVQLGDCMLTYSKDGAHCTDTDGVEVWNQTYQMQNPMIEICGDTVAIGDYNGREVYVLNAKKKICQINTTMPIKNIAVAANGRTAVEVIDGKVTWIYIYEVDGTQAFTTKTTMSQSGYPAAFGFSPNGELLGMSCIFVDAGEVKSQVAFYNYGPVGENKVNYIVGAYTYPEVVIPYIKFISDDMAVAVGDDRILFYSGDQVPVLKTSQMFEDEVQGVYQDGEHLGVLFRSDILEMRNKMDVYDVSAEKVGSYYFNTQFQDIVFTKDYFVAYGDRECTIRTYDNIEKYTGAFERSVDLMFPVGRGHGYKFVMVSDNTLSTVQMK